MLHFLEKRSERKVYEQAKKDFREAGMLSGTPEANAAANRVLNAFDDLHDGNPPIDSTPRIDGVPIK